METYLFIPASRDDFLDKVEVLPADYFVLDLEDSVSLEDREKAIGNILGVSNNRNQIIRIFWDTTGEYTPNNLIDIFSKNGFKKFLIPKITDGSQLKLLVNKVSKIDNIELNILVENPVCLVHLKEILATYNIERTFFGSYDYCSTLTIKHIPANYEWPKSYMLHVAKGFDTKAIDVPHLNLKEETQFLEDSRKAFQIGFDGKAIIHPKQLSILNNTTLYKEKDLKIALYLKNVIESKENIPAIINYKGNYYETTHLGYFNKILKMAGYEEINYG